jgi:hypothetical protein
MDIGLQILRPGVGVIALDSITAVTLKNGDVLRVTASMKYSGPEQTVTLYGAVGVDSEGVNATWDLIGFDEALVGQNDWELPASTGETVTGSVDIPIVVNTTAKIGPSGYENMLPPGNSWDLYIKIRQHSSISYKSLGVINLSSEGAGGGGITNILSSILPLLVIGLMVFIMSKMSPMMQGEEES